MLAPLFRNFAMLAPLFCTPNGVCTFNWNNYQILPSYGSPSLLRHNAVSPSHTYFGLCFHPQPTYTTEGTDNIDPDTPEPYKYHIIERDLVLILRIRIIPITHNRSDTPDDTLWTPMRVIPLGRGRTIQVVNLESWATTRHRLVPCI